jgi:hypothetical protein
MLRPAHRIRVRHATHAFEAPACDRAGITGQLAAGVEYAAAIDCATVANCRRMVAGALTSTLSPNASNHQRNCGVSLIVT